jgi:hypothetical protein
MHYSKNETTVICGCIIVRVVNFGVCKGINSYSVMHEVCTGHIVKCEFDARKLRCSTIVKTMGIQSLSMNTAVEIHA